MGARAWLVMSLSTQATSVTKRKAKNFYIFRIVNGKSYRLCSHGNLLKTLVISFEELLTVAITVTLQEGEDEKCAVNKKTSIGLFYFIVASGNDKSSFILSAS